MRRHQPSEGRQLRRTRASRTGPGRCRRTEPNAQAPGAPRQRRRGSGAREQPPRLRLRHDVSHLGARPTSDRMPARGTSFRSLCLARQCRRCGAEQITVIRGPVRRRHHAYLGSQTLGLQVPGSLLVAEFPYKVQLGVFAPAAGLGRSVAHRGPSHGRPLSRLTRRRRQR